MELKNYMEDLVLQHLDRVLNGNPRACHCQKCRYDIAALALNFLPPRYIVGHKGETYTRVKSLEQQFTIDIITAITNAIKIVNAEPHHIENE